MADSIHKLAAQYFQLVELQNLALPPGPVLVQPAVQAALYERMFNENAVFPIPPDSYRSRVLKEILSRIEESITNPEEDVGQPTCFNPSILHFYVLNFLFLPFLSHIHPPFTNAKIHFLYSLIQPI
jgi:hypothetical protein